MIFLLTENGINVKKLWTFTSSYSPASCWTRRPGSSGGEDMHFTRMILRILAVHSPRKSEEIVEKLRYKSLPVGANGKALKGNLDKILTLFVF